MPCRQHIKAEFLDQRICFSVIRMPFSRWLAFCWMVSNNYSETVKYDEKQQTKNQRVSIFQTRFILCSLYYCIAYSTSRMPHSSNLPAYAKQRPVLYSIINCNKIQTFFGQTSENIFYEVT